MEPEQYDVQFYAGDELRFASVLAKHEGAESFTERYRQEMLRQLEQYEDLFSTYEPEYIYGTPRQIQRLGEHYHNGKRGHHPTFVAYDEHRRLLDDPVYPDAGPYNTETGKILGVLNTRDRTLVPYGKYRGMERSQTRADSYDGSMALPRPVHGGRGSLELHHYRCDGYVLAELLMEGYRTI